MHGTTDPKFLESTLSKSAQTCSGAHMASFAVDT